MSASTIELVKVILQIAALACLVAGAITLFINALFVQDEEPLDETDAPGEEQGGPHE